MVILMENFVDLEEELSCVRANLQIEESYSSSLLRTNLPDFAGKVVAVCFNSLTV